MVVSWSDYKQWAGSNITNLPQDLSCPHPNNISTDSRSIQKGQWFLPLSGANFNGNNFVNDALKKGAAGVFYEKKSRNLVASEALKAGVEVEDAYLLLCQVAGGWRTKFPKLQIAGITGSSGKTTAKELTRLVCEAAGSTLYTPASFNNEIGVPLTLLKITEHHKYAVIEMAARHKGDISHLGKIVQPTVACLLNVGEAHLGEFGSLENLIAGKLEIFTHVFEGATLVVNGDDARLKVHKRSDCKVLKFGCDASVDVRVTDQKPGVSLTLAYKGTSFSIATRYHHEFLAKNVAAVFAMGVGMGISPERIIEGVSRFDGIKGRYKIHRFDDKVVIDDAYNANPQSMLAGLKSLKQQFSSQDKVLILGDMLELGAESQQSHYRVGEAAGQISGAHLVTVGRDSKSIGAGAVHAGLPHSRHVHFDNIEQFLSNSDKIEKLGNVFYVKASHSIGLEKIVEHLLSTFSN